MKKKSIIIIIILVILVLIALVGKNLFASVDNSRLSGNSKYKLSNNEKNSIIDKLEEIENVKSVNVYKNIKIIKIIINLSEDTDFEKVKQTCNESLKLFSDKNLSYFDIEVYINSDNKESEVYPKIGYKHKLKEEFAW